MWSPVTLSGLAEAVGASGALLGHDADSKGPQDAGAPAAAAGVSG